jgi:hypothetical protein
MCPFMARTWFVMASSAPADMENPMYWPGCVTRYGPGCEQRPRSRARAPWQHMSAVTLQQCNSYTVVVHQGGKSELTMLCNQHIDTSAQCIGSPTIHACICMYYT